jgi:hypothetical protein
MCRLIRFNEYSRKEIHDIFSPDTSFTAGAGYWGISGIIKVPFTEKDYIFLVTYGQKQADHEFNESIDNNGILTWQSQPSQSLHTPQILNLINHNYLKDNIYLFLRTNEKNNYKYMGLLAYVEHDNQREKPVYFKWQILDWDVSDYSKSENNSTTEEKYVLTLSEEKEDYIANNRKGKSTKEFFNNRNVDFEGEIRKNTILGKKGEEIVAEYEKIRLIGKGKEVLANKVRLTSEIAGNAEKFDVLSFDENGNEKYIEVKSTRGGLNNLFHISESEIDFSWQFADKYYLYRVYNLDPKTRSADLKIIKGAINREKLQAIEYTCRIGGKFEEV